MSKVTIYTTPTCGYCQMAKAFFKEHDVTYEEKDVAVDASARKEMLDISGQMGVPVIDIDGSLFVGFDEKGLSNALKLS